MKPKPIPPEHFLNLARKAFDSGATPNGVSLHWDASGECSQPVNVVYMTTFERDVLWRANGEWADGLAGAHWIPVPTGHPRQQIRDGEVRYMDILNPCRKCFACLKARSLLWGSRAFHETNWSTRTWMLTFTLNPHERMIAAINARERYGDESFQSLARIMGRWFTLYMKRVRKQAKGVPLRYLLAVEEHKDGFPHLHALIHERGPVVGKRLLQEQWTHGFSHCKLADPRAARYVTKYVSKQLASRVRASQRYGRPDAIGPVGAGGPDRTVINVPSETEEKED